MRLDNLKRLDDNSLWKGAELYLKLLGPSSQEKNVMFSIK